MKRDAPRPAHSLDYFHGSLSVSPDGAWVVDSGWVSAPIGVVRAWTSRYHRGAKEFLTRTADGVRRSRLRAAP